MVAWLSRARTKETAFAINSCFKSTRGKKMSEKQGALHANRAHNLQNQCHILSSKTRN